jgi:hypothetical protein
METWNPVFRYGVNLHWHYLGRNQSWKGKEANVTFGGLFGYGFKTTARDHMHYHCVHTYIQLYFPGCKRSNY